MPPYDPEVSVKYRQQLEGGIVTSLDSIPPGNRKDMDFAFTLDHGTLYVHKYEAASAVPHLSPHVIIPIDTPVAGRWIQQNISGESGHKTGDLILRAGTDIPVGSLECDGTELDVTIYSTLHGEIGFNHGGNGLDKFRIPDYRGMFLRGWDHAAGTDPDAASRIMANLGGVTGDLLGAIQFSQNISHAHNFILDEPANDAPGSYHGYVRNRVFNWRPVMRTYADGGAEARSINATTLFCIKY